VEPDVGLAEVKVRFREGRVAENENHDGAAEERDGARRLDVHEALEGADQPIYGAPTRDLSGAWCRAIDGHDEDASLQESSGEQSS
jgi:hypothetical protein